MAHSDKAKKFLKSKFDFYINENNNNYKYVGDNIGPELKKYKYDSYKLILPSILNKHVNNVDKWMKFLEDEDILEELLKVGVSISNTLKPLAGSTLEEWVCEILNLEFVRLGINLGAERRGVYKKQIDEHFKKIKQYVDKDTGEISDMNKKPDIDIVVFNKKTKKVVSIISCKTSLAERVMQTISWQGYTDIPIYLVTAWELFKGDIVNKERVQALAGVYVCDEDVVEYKNIKIFSKIFDDLMKYN